MDLTKKFSIDICEKDSWNKVEDILNPKNDQVFEDRIYLDDIIQGSIGNCYFRLQLVPYSNLDRLFLSKKRQRNTYMVFLFSKMSLGNDYRV